MILATDPSSWQCAAPPRPPVVFPISPHFVFKKSNNDSLPPYFRVKRNDQTPSCFFLSASNGPTASRFPCAGAFPPRTRLTKKKTTPPLSFSRVMESAASWPPWNLLSRQILFWFFFCGPFSDEPGCFFPLELWRATVVFCLNCRGILHFCRAFLATIPFEYSHLGECGSRPPFCQQIVIFFPIR